MRAGALKTEALQALLVGAARGRPDFAALIDAPGGDAKADLKAAALLAQALRLERPAAPAAFAVVAPPSARRAFLAEPLRAPLTRLVGEDKLAVSPQDDLALGLALALERARFSPHPYDFHRLEGFLRVHAERLGAEAREWLDREGKSEAKRGYFDLEVLTPENWSDAPTARRARFLEDERRRDPGGARALLEAVFSGEGAETRLRLLQTLRASLGPDDKPFLEGLASDRAPKVRDLAARLLARLPGAANETPALMDFVSRVQQSTSGIFRKRVALTLELPATVAKGDWVGWLVEALAEIELDELCDALRLAPEAALAAAGEDAPLTTAFALLSARARRFDLVAAIARASPAPFQLLARGAFEEETFVAPEDCSAFAEAVFQPGPKPEGFETARALGLLFRLLKGPASVAAFDAMLALAARQRADAGEAVASALVTPLVALAPRARHAAARAFADERSEKPDRFHAYLDLIEALEGNAPHD